MSSVSSSPQSLLKERNLNVYEGMLVTSTCNVAVSCLVPTSSSSTLEENIQQAWQQTISQRGLLQVTLEQQKSSEQGFCYKAMPVVDRGKLPPVTIVHGDRSSGVETAKTTTPSDMLKVLQKQGTNDLDITKATYVMKAMILSGGRTDSSTTKTAVTFYLTLCHALSDGPGTLHVLHDFLQNLKNSVCCQMDTTNVVNEDRLAAKKQPTLIDIQALLLGSTYGRGSNDDDKDDLLYPGLNDFNKSLASANVCSDDNNRDGAQRHRVLPPERLQKLPSDVEDKHLQQTPITQIDALCFTLTKEQTTNLRSTCRSWGGTIQGIISVSCLFARLLLLQQTQEAANNNNLSFPITCALQIPINTRKAANVDETECLCGAAGVWHTLHLEKISNETTTVSSLVQQASNSVKEAVTKKEQHLECLKRLMNNPASLPTYSLMVSSIGVAPIQRFYDNDGNNDDNNNRSIEVVNGVFFGGALTSTKAYQPSNLPQATMVHVTTFCDQLEFTFNFTSPGVSKEIIGHGTINMVKRLLIAIAEKRLVADDTVSTAFDLMKMPSSS